MTRTTISQEDLSENLPEIIDRVQPGEVVIIQQADQEQVVLMDPVDFRLLHALARCASAEQDRGQEADDSDVQALRACLAMEISLGKAAELLGLHRLELQEHLHRLGAPLHLGPATLEEAWAEIEAARSIP
jgi:antitoxin (DNA-binding transcriptional repressor) of toxin-antitoxin stability system